MRHMLLLAATLLVWMTLGTILGVDWLRVFNIFDMVDSTGDEVDAVTITEEQKILNKCAQSYCTKLYGPDDSRLHRPLRRGVGAGVMTLAVIVLLALILPAAHPIPLAQDLLAPAAVGALVLTESFVWRRRQLARNWGTKSYQETRQFLAQQATARVGGPEPFLERVKMAYGEIPPLSAPLMAPYWGRNLIPMAWVAASVAWVLVGTADFSWPPAAWVRLHDLPHGVAVLWLMALDAALVGYFGLVACLSTSPWGAIQVGKRYYPLQIFCRDLERVEKEKKVEATGLG